MSSVRILIINMKFVVIIVEIDQIFYRTALDSLIKLTRAGDARALNHVLIVLKHAGTQQNSQIFMDTKSSFCKQLKRLCSMRFGYIALKNLLESCSSPRDLEKCLHIFDVARDWNSYTYSSVFKILYLCSVFDGHSTSFFRQYSFLSNELMLHKSIQLSKVSYDSIFHGLLNLSEVQNDRHCFELCISYFQRMLKVDCIRTRSSEVILMRFLFTFPF